MMMLIVWAILPMLGSSQGKYTSNSVDSLTQFVYVGELYLGSMITSAYDVNSIYYNKKYTHINECSLTSGLSNLKVQTVEIFTKNFPSIATKLHERNTYVVIHFFQDMMEL